MICTPWSPRRLDVNVTAGLWKNAGLIITVRIVLPSIVDLEIYVATEYQEQMQPIKFGTEVARSSRLLRKRRSTFGSLEPQDSFVRTKKVPQSDPRNVDVLNGGCYVP